MNKLEEDILVVLSHPEDFWVGLKKEEVTSIKKLPISYNIIHIVKSMVRFF